MTADKQLIDAARYAAFYLREFDADFIHDEALQEPGFKVAENGRCNNLDCVLCNLERILEEVDPPSDLEETTSTTINNLDVKEAQLLLTL
jgi:hypothetical protein